MERNSETQYRISTFSNGNAHFSWSQNTQRCKNTKEHLCGTCVTKNGRVMHAYKQLSKKCKTTMIGEWRIWLKFRYNKGQTPIIDVAKIIKKETFILITCIFYMCAITDIFVLHAEDCVQYRRM